MKYIIVHLVSFLALQTLAVGFNAELTSQPIYGNTWITCNDYPNTTTQHFYCDEFRLEPFEFGYFYGPEGIDADSFEITAIWENGKSRRKEGKYSSLAGRSESRLNLWIETLLQRSLLNEGKNKISYKMKKSNEIIARGEFDLFIRRAKPIVCPTGSLHSSNALDCNSSLNACREYYRIYGPQCRK